MCRITGFWDLNSIDYDSKEVIGKMRDTMTTGGPDGSGAFQSKQSAGLALGHRRLSIIDLSEHGNQPMSFGNWTICYNGEVYNYQEIKQELIDAGMSFSTDSDTEVVLKAFIHWGFDSFSKFHGMWAVALWNEGEQKLILTRDRVGVKPLFWYKQNNLFMFSSELKAFHKHPKFRGELSSIGLKSYFQYSYIPSPGCILKNTYKLAPGTIVTVDNQLNIEEKCYWSAKEIYHQPKTSISFGDAESQLESILSRSFERRLVSDVPLGIFLSGGVDSSLLLSLLAKKHSKLKTFTIGFDNPKFNEAQYAKEVARALGSQHNELYLKEDAAIQLIPDLPQVWDEPLADASALPTLLLCRFASKYVKVALSSDGGDELFAGYPKYWLSLQRASKLEKMGLITSGLKFLPNTIVHEISDKLRLGNKLNKLAEFAEFNSNDLLEFSFVYGQRNFSNSQISSLIVDQKGIKFPTRDFFGLWKEINLDHLEKMLLTDIMTYHPDDILAKVDRASMSTSLECRDPFLDHEIIEFAASLPPDFKFDGTTNKKILKSILYRHIDRKLVERPKMGFGVPLHQWLLGELTDLYHEILDPIIIEKDGILNAKAVTKIKKQFESYPEAHINKIWPIFCFQLWKKRWL